MRYDHLILSAGSYPSHTSLNRSLLDDAYSHGKFTAQEFATYERAFGALGTLWTVEYRLKYRLEYRARYRARRALHRRTGGVQKAVYVFAYRKAGCRTEQRKVTQSVSRASCSEASGLNV